MARFALKLRQSLRVDIKGDAQFELKKPTMQACSLNAKLLLIVVSELVALKPSRSKTPSWIS